MIERKCVICNKIFFTYPCRIKIGIGKYCSRACYSVDRNKALITSGKNTRFKQGHKPCRDRNLPSGDKHHYWKGENVGYRGLHYWLRRVKGIPAVCEFCGELRTTPKSIQWANVDGEYRRNPDDYISLCAKCHKEYDALNS